MNMPMVWGEPEIIYLRKFFDEVDRAITEEMQAGKSLLEENLTFVLARLLDEKSTFQRMLDYSVEKLNADLEKCGTGAQISIEFETNEHKRHFESSVSYADLGIVLRSDHSVFGPGYTKAIIVQSKKLYPAKDEYRLRSRYEGFEKRQFEELMKIASKYGGEGVVYFMYNPKLEAFVEDDAKILRALEARMMSSYYWGIPHEKFWHPEIDFIIHKFLGRKGLPLGTGIPTADTISPEELLEKRQKIMEFKPGLRVLGIYDVTRIVKPDKSIRGSFHLEECYRYALSGRWLRDYDRVPFFPFSSYIVDLFMGCRHGSDNENLIKIAEGCPPGPGDDENNAPGIAAKHTLRVTVKNTLPKMDLMFHK